jgi:hypothetical protein
MRKVEQAELERLRESLDSKVRERFPDAAIQRVEVLGYGDEPQIEPGQLMARVYLDAPEPMDDYGPVLDSFHNANRAAIEELRQQLDRLPFGTLEFLIGAEEGQKKRRVMRLGAGPRGGMPGAEGQLTPVMARLGPDDLKTLDTLITVGIASSRAEGIRWALARIRERPAYQQLRTHAREIEELKSQF